MQHLDIQVTTIKSAETEAEGREERAAQAKIPNLIDKVRVKS